MEHTVTFRQGERAPEPVVFDCTPGFDPIPVIIAPNGHHIRIHDGDRITVRDGVAVRVGSEPKRE